MRDLSLHLMDIIQNSVTAGATRISVTVKTDKSVDWMEIEVLDNGKGMDNEFLKLIGDPFVTTRITRGIGLGIPLFEASAKRAGGTLKCTSRKGEGTKIGASFRISHIDRLPLGDVEDTLVNVIVANQDIEFILMLNSGKEHFRFDTLEVKERLGEVPITHSEVVSWIREYIRDGIKSIFGGVLDEIDS